MIPYLPLLATVIPGIAGILLFLFGKRVEKIAGWIATFVAFSAVVFIIGMTNPLIETYNSGQNYILFEVPWIIPLNIEFGFLIDMINFPIGLVIAVISTLSCFYSIKYMEKVKNQATFYGNLLIFVSGMIGVVFSSNLIQLYLFWELMLIPSYLLISQFGISKRKLSIGFKYFIFTHTGALLLLHGILTIFSDTLSFDLVELTYNTSLSPHLIPITFVLLLSGFLVKMAAFPVHTWLPDAHSEAPTPISAMLSGLMIKSGAYGVVRILISIFGPTMIQASDVLLSLALITMIYGGLMALAQRDLKRLLAYSSISQIGYILFGFATMSTLGIMGSLLHIVNHAICKALLFMCAGSIVQQTRTRNIRKMSGLIIKMPITGICMLIGLFSLAGTPPLNAFWSEWMIFGGGINAGKIIFSYIGVASTVITAGYFLWFAWRVLFGEVPKQFERIKESNPILLIPIVLLASATIILGIWPGIALEFIKPAADLLSSLTGIL